MAIPTKELVTVPPYLQNHLSVADGLVDRFPEAPVDDVHLVAGRIHDLVALVANRDALVEKLLDRLRLITRAALDHTDGDSQPHDTHFAEIVGIAEGDPDWLRHARVNYETKHARLVELSKSLYLTALESEDSAKGATLAIEQIADQIEQELLPEMMLGEDGRTFLKSQGLPLRDPRR